MYRPFILQFQTLIGELGYKTITEFINKWISEGGTFQSISEWLLLRGFEFKFITVYINLRKFLTIPYDIMDQYFYKWNAIAKSKDFDSAQQMVSSLLSKYTINEITKELNTDRKTFKELRHRLSDPNAKPGKPKSKKHKNRDGFARGSTSENWRSRWEEKGFKGLRDAIQKMRLRGLDFKDIAREFNTTNRNLRYRMKSARLNPKDFPKKRKPFKKILKLQPKIK
jgi:hypothetical protein